MNHAESMARAGAGRSDRDALLQAVHNPFATRWVRPGALAFEFPPHDSLADVVRRFKEHGRRGAIIGPHGSGKSTLLAAMLARLTAEGETTCLITPRQDDRTTLRRAWSEIKRHAATVVAIDGHEQLGRYRRWIWERSFGRKLGLIVTSHGVTRLPTLLQTSPSLALAEKLAARLLSAGARGDQLDEAYRDCLRRSHAARGGDLREVLFDLYDLYESRRATGGKPRGARGD